MIIPTIFPVDKSGTPADFDGVSLPFVIELVGWIDDVLVGLLFLIELVAWMEAPCDGLALVIELVPWINNVIVGLLFLIELVAWIGVVVLELLLLLSAIISRYNHLKSMSCSLIHARCFSFFWMLFCASQADNLVIMLSNDFSVYRRCKQSRNEWWNLHCMTKLSSWFHRFS